MASSILDVAFVASLLLIWAKVLFVQIAIPTNKMYKIHSGLNVLATQPVYLHIVSILYVE